jgi:hypothetical protein
MGRQKDLLACVLLLDIGDKLDEVDVRQVIVSSRSSPSMGTAP